MKHTVGVTILMLVLFFVSQFLGLTILDAYVDKVQTLATGELTYKPLPFDQERPEVEENYSFVYIFIALIVGTIIALGLIKWKLFNVWKVWFFIALWLTIAISLAAFVNEITAAIIGLVIALLKLLKRSVWFHNITEVLVYAGVAAILVPVMNIFAGIMLLVIVSIYDFYAVYKSKHMVTLAEAQSSMDFFAGFSIPYDKKSGSLVKPISKSEKKTSKLVSKSGSDIRMAMLGGGDIAFCLLFSGIVLKHFPILLTLLVPLGATIALGYLFFMAKEKTYYPAMPFVSVGCLLSYGLLLLL